MTGTILDNILEAKRLRIEQMKSVNDIAILKVVSAAAINSDEPHRLRRALSDRSRINIIAEFKKASPSKGLINGGVDPAEIAKLYMDGGAAAISVLTEEDFFMGSLGDLLDVRTAVDIPVLRKDFVFDEYQIYEAHTAGADAILLIAAMLDDNQLERFRSLAEDELGLDALVEVHTLDELERSAKIGATLLGVNNRDLKTFHVTLDVSRELIRHAPEGTLMVAESGLQYREDLIELHSLGYSGFLIGETLMRTGDPTAELRRLRDTG